MYSLLPLNYFSAIDRRGEQRSEVYFYGHTYLNYLTPGILYEAVVISINNILETESDPQEIFTEPSERLKLFTVDLSTIFHHVLFNAFSIYCCHISQCAFIS